jgi:RHS repeat-associated protein
MRFHSEGGRLERIGETQYLYDADGRTIEKREGDRVWQYKWSIEGQLSSVVTPDGEHWNYEYDAFGRRVRKSGPRGTTTYVWDGSVVAQEIHEGHSVAWFFEPGTFRPIAKQENGNTYACVTDQVGTPRELVSSNGTLAWSAQFTAFGETETVRANETDCAIRFQGQWFDEESGLHYNWNRYYEPGTGRYLSPDPIGLDGGTRSYGYVHNPMGWVDPWGLAGDDVVPQVANPNDLNYSQRTVGPEVQQYTDAMNNGNWDWSRSGPLRVMDQNGQLVSYDNRRLMAAQNAGLDSVPIEQVDPNGIMPGSKKTWGKAFDQRMNDPRNIAEGGPIPEGGLESQPRMICK